MSNNNRHENTEKYMKALNICITILERRQSDWYMEIPHDLVVEGRDWKVYCSIIEKYHENWWD